MEQHGIRFRFENYQASDGVGITVYYLEKGGQAQAIEAFSQEINHALKVLESGKKKDKHAKVVGERANILCLSINPTPPVHAVIWTDGKTFYEIASSSLEHVLEFEKYY